jgi:hypothetical protein
MEPLPIPIATEDERTALRDLALRATNAARARYDLHCAMRHRISTDLLSADTKPNQKLTAWWTLGEPDGLQPFTAFREEVKKLRKRDLPMYEREQWDPYLSAKLMEHRHLTDQIVAAESEINDRVYRLFGLSAEEIRVVDEETKYRLGEV